MERVQRGTPPVRLKELLVGATQQKIMTRPRDSPRARSSKVHSTQRPSFCCSSGPRQLSQHPGTSTSLPLFDTNISLAREANTDQPLSLPEQKGTTQTVLAGQLSLPGQNCYIHTSKSNSLATSQRGSIGDHFCCKFLFVWHPAATSPHHRTERRCQRKVWTG